MALNKNDLNKIGSIIDERLESRLETHKEDILEEIENKLTKLRNDFFEKVDPILKEVTTSREERPLIENRLEKLEEIHPQGKHSLQQ